MSRDTAKVQVLSCGCICRRYDGRIIVVDKRCSYHRVWTKDEPRA